MREEECFICDCHSDEHQLVFRYDDAENEIYTSVYLNQYRNIFERILTAVKYVFGYKSKYGDWDCFILKESEADRLTNYLSIFKKKKTMAHTVSIDGELIFARNKKDLIEKIKNVFNK